MALTWAAAATERIRLMPNILVLPYRNPFVVAKAVATLDALSGGRFTLAVATGYLKGEYRALGVDFAERNDLFDEAIEVLRGIWTTDDFAYEGRHFTAFGQTANPKPAALPPIWIGGNSKLSRRRVARYGDGWKPFPAARSLATTAKTPPLETVEDLAEMLDDLWEQVDGPAATARRSTCRSEPAPAATRVRTASIPTPSWPPSTSWPASASPGPTCGCRATRSTTRSRRSSSSARR